MTFNFDDHFQVDLPRADNIYDGPPTTVEIDRVLRHLKNGKSPGADEIHAEMIRITSYRSIHELHKLFKVFWQKLCTPRAYSQSIIVPIPKKGDKLECIKYRGISLIDIVGKILCHVILNRLMDALAPLLRPQQAGFMPGKSCTDQIFSLRMILQRSSLWRTSAAACFIDFQKAFDSVHRPTMWNILERYGCPLNTLAILKSIYCNTMHCVRIGSKTSDWFSVSSGVRQGDPVAPFLFVVALDFVMRHAIQDQTTGLAISSTKNICDLIYADDIALVSDTFTNLQPMISSLDENGRKLGLFISKSKTKCLRNDKPVPHLDLPPKIDNEELDEVGDFIYLGSSIPADGFSGKEIRRRIALASSSFSDLKNIRFSNTFTLHTKL